MSMTAEVLEEEKQPLTTGAIISELQKIRTEKRQLSKRKEELDAEWRALELELMIRMEEQGSTKVTSTDGTASITKTVLPNVVDWDEFYAHIKENDAFYLLQRSPTAAAFREIVASGDSVPGVEPYTKRSISLRKA